MYTLNQYRNHKFFKGETRSIHVDKNELLGKTENKQNLKPTFE